MGGGTKLLSRLKILKEKKFHKINSSFLSIMQHFLQKRLHNESDNGCSTFMDWKRKTIFPGSAYGTSLHDLKCWHSYFFSMTFKNNE